MAELWCHKMQWIFDKWLAGGMAALSADDLAGYEEPVREVRMSEGARLAFDRRLEDIRRLAPR